MKTSLETPFAVSLSWWIPNDDISEYLYWSGWERHYWPADVIRPGRLVYGFDGRPSERRLRFLLRVTHGGGFTYRTSNEFREHVHELTKRWPNEAGSHWPSILPRKQRTMTGIAARFKLLKHVDIPHPNTFPQLGWERFVDEDEWDVVQRDTSDLYEEGRRVWRTHQQIERNPRLRTDSKNYWRKRLGGRLRCIACKFDFADRYGEIGNDFIEMHHEEALARSKGKVQQMVTSLKPICSNCHRMVHRDLRSPLSISKLRRILAEHRRSEGH